MRKYEEKADNELKERKKEILLKWVIIRKYNDDEILHKRTYKANEISRTF